MTLVDADTGEIVEPPPFTANEAHAWANGIRASWSDLTERIIEGHQRRAWLALGHGSWNEMCAQLNLPRIEDRDQRRELVADLRGSGMSTRAIGAALGASKSSVDRDLAGVPNGTPDTVTGADGKRYPATRKQPEVEDIAGETVLHDPDSGEPTVIGDPDLTPTPDYEPEPKPPITKPDLGGGISHPARFSDAIIARFAEILDGNSYRILDPFAGTGRIHELETHGHETVGVEIEAEYAAMHPDTICASALDLPFLDHEFDVIATSPTYGNRLADSHNASDPHLRRSYTHDLGHALAPGNSGAMQWGSEYRAFHRLAWIEATRVLEVGGLFLLNIKDHIRSGAQQPVTAWHVGALVTLGLQLNAELSAGVPTQHLRQGSTGERAGQELVLVFVKVGA